jgi:hypothetical protein
LILRPLLLTNEEIRSYLGAIFLLRFLFVQKMKGYFHRRGAEDAEVRWDFKNVMLRKVGHTF